MSGARRDRPQTLEEATAVCKVLVALVHDALAMSLNTPRAQRAVEMIALRATIPDRLVAEGVDPERATRLAPTIKVNVEVSEDAD